MIFFIPIDFKKKYCKDKRERVSTYDHEIVGRAITINNINNQTKKIKSFTLQGVEKD